MNLSLSFLGVSGHSEVTFTKEGALLKWSEISDVEKKALHALITSARKGGCETFSVDKDGKIVMEAQKDGTFRIIKAGRFELKDEPQKVTSATAPAGG